MGKRRLLTVQNVIDVKDKVTFKVLLANWWNPSSELGSYTSTKNGKSNEI